MSIDETYDPGLLKLCAWMGPLFVALFVIGAVPAGYFPPHLAEDGAGRITELYSNNLFLMSALVILCSFKLNEVF